MQTRSLKTLVTISKVGSFAVAADQLHMTPSAVSMQMKSLEAELGVDLFDRTFRPPKLTPIGRQVAERATQVSVAEDQLLELCRGKDDLVGQFRVGFVPTAGVRLLPGFLQNASEDVPRARFDVEVDVSEALERRVESGQMDAAVVTATATRAPGLKYAILRDEALVFAVPRSETRAVADLTDGPLPFLQFTPSVGIGNLIAGHMAELGGIGRHQRIVLNNVEAIMQCVNRGIGYTLLPEPDVRRYADDAVSIRPPLTSLTRQLALVTLPASPIGHRMDLVASLFD